MWTKLTELILDHDRRQIGEHHLHCQVMRLAMHDAEARLKQMGADDNFFKHRKSWAMKFKMPQITDRTPIELKRALEEEFFKVYSVWWENQ